MYTSRNNSNSYPTSELHMLADELKTQWNIFSDSLGTSSIYEIIKSVSSNLYEEYQDLFDQPVGIPEKYDQDYLEEHTILRGNSWDDFVKSIKHKNRFHTQMINTDKLNTYLSFLRKDYSVGACLIVAAFAITT